MKVPADRDCVALGFLEIRQDEKDALVRRSVLTAPGHVLTEASSIGKPPMTQSLPASRAGRSLAFAPLSTRSRAVRRLRAIKWISTFWSAALAFFEKHAPIFTGR